MFILSTILIRRRKHQLARFKTRQYCLHGNTDIRHTALVENDVTGGRIDSNEIDSVVVWK